MKKIIKSRYGKAAVAVCLLCLLFVLGCLASYGMLRPSSEVSRLFEGHTVSPEYNYFYLGSETKPIAILAIAKDYTLVTELWNPVSPTPRQLKKWVDNMTSPTGMPLHTYGAAVCEPSGKQVGIWYSQWNRTVVEMKGEKAISVYPPQKGEHSFRSMRFAD